MKLGALLVVLIGITGYTLIVKLILAQVVVREISPPLILLEVPSVNVHIFGSSLVTLKEMLKKMVAQKMCPCHVRIVIHQEYDAGSDGYQWKEEVETYGTFTIASSSKGDIFNLKPGHRQYTLFLNDSLDPSQLLMWHSCNFAQWHVGLKPHTSRKVGGFQGWNNPGRNLKGPPQISVEATREPLLWGTVFSPYAFTLFSSWILRRLGDDGKLNGVVLDQLLSTWISVSTMSFLTATFSAKGLLVPSNSRVKQKATTNVFVGLRIDHIQSFQKDGAIKKCKYFQQDPGAFLGSLEPNISRILRQKCPMAMIQNLLKSSGISISSLNWKQLYALSLIKLRSESKCVLIVEPILGLGNRLRVLVSAIAYARATKCVLIVIWKPGASCQASFPSLFQTSSETLFFDDNSWLYDFNWFNKMFLRVFPIRNDSHRRFDIDQSMSSKIYLETFLPIKSRHVTQQTLRSSIGELLLYVSDEVKDSLSVLTTKLRPVFDAHELLATAHIREVLPGRGDLAIPALAPQSMWRVLPYRLACQSQLFVLKLRPLLEHGYHVIISTDNIKSLRLALGGNFAKQVTILKLTKMCLRTRAEPCVVRALATIILLGHHGSKFIGSHWSSFSEVVGYLANSTMNGCYEPIGGWSPQEEYKMVRKHRRGNSKFHEGAFR